MSAMSAIEHVWSIILAGGEGERTRPFIEGWLGYPLPKQYCTFVGTRSMLRHTLDRANQVSPGPQKITVVGRSHRQLAWSHLEALSGGQILLQPNNCQTAAGIFLPLTYVLTRDPEATVVVFPSDHFVFPEQRFVDTVRRAVRAAEILTDRLILLGVRPTSLELEYGWMETGPTIGWSGGLRVRQVTSFIEKPDPVLGLKAMADGALWNTLVLAAKAETVWQLGRRLFPDIIERFERLKPALGTPRETHVLNEIYRDMPHRNFSSDLLQRVPESVGVIELEEVLWSDWGRPERIIETLRLLGKSPAFPIPHEQGSESSRSHPMPTSLEVS